MATMRILLKTCFLCKKSTVKLSQCIENKKLHRFDIQNFMCNFARANSIKQLKSKEQWKRQELV